MGSIVGEFFLVKLRLVPGTSGSIDGPETYNPGEGRHTKAQCDVIVTNWKVRIDGHRLMTDMGKVRQQFCGHGNNFFFFFLGKKLLPKRSKSVQALLRSFVSSSANCVTEVRH